jgi:hypothetical protein
VISNKLKLISAIVVGMTASQFANAALTVTSSVGGIPVGSNKVNFDTIAAGVATGPNGSITLSFTGTAGAVTGQAGAYAPPVLSNNNGAGFGSPDQADGVDATQYLTTGTGSVTMAFAQKQLYLGLLWGSVDDYNTLELFNGAVSVGTVIPGTTTGMPSKGGNQSAAGTLYVNIFSTLQFDRVVATSSSNAFEFDNVSFNVVPEPSTYVAGLLLALPVVVQGVRRLKNRQ